METPSGDSRPPLSPVHRDRVSTKNPKAGPAEGIALCLSGGGYRAMIFHLGALWRLNELGYLGQLRRVSSVSGGSITAGVLALAWPELQFGADGRAANFVERVVTPLREFAGRTIDVPAIALGIAIPSQTISDRIAGYYRSHLFHDATLQSLPESPEFVINATS